MKLDCRPPVLIGTSAFATIVKLPTTKRPPPDRLIGLSLVMGIFVPV